MLYSLYMKKMYMRISRYVTYVDNVLQLSEASFIQLCRLAEETFNLKITIEKL